MMIAIVTVVYFEDFLGVDRGTGGPRATWLVVLAEDDQRVGRLWEMSDSELRASVG